MDAAARRRIASRAAGSLVPALLLSILFLGGCGRDASGEAVTVFAASSLTEAFEEIGAAYEDAHPDTDVTFNFAGSQELRAQLEQGARADVFASANAAQMDLAVASGVVHDGASVFARNRLVVIVPPDNPAHVESFRDLGGGGINLILGHRNVPVGDYARRALEHAATDPAYGADFSERVLDNLVSEESNVRQVTAKIQLGEADAGIVYSSDITPDVADDVLAIDIPDDLNELASYPIAITTDSGDAAGARAFIEFVLSEEGQAILAAHGFLPPAS